MDPGLLYKTNKPSLSVLLIIYAMSIETFKAANDVLGYEVALIGVGDKK